MSEFEDIKGESVTSLLVSIMKSDMYNSSDISLDSTGTSDSDDMVSEG